MNLLNSFFPSDDVFHKTSACSSRLAQLAHVFPKNTWLGGVGAGAPAGKAPLRKWLARLVLGAAREQVVGKRAT